MKKIIVFSLSFLVIAACATKTNYADVTSSWKGSDATSLVSKWGQPDTTKQAANGNKVLVYKDHWENVIPDYSQTAGSAAPTTNLDTINPSQVQVHNCTTWVEVDNNNKIVNITYKGNACKATNKQKQTLVHV